MHRPARRARFALPAALLGIRRLAHLTRHLAGGWCGVPITERYVPQPEGKLTFTERLRWLATDRGFGVVAPGIADKAACPGVRHA